MDSWALISVSDKTGLESLARQFVRDGLKLLATSSTARYLGEKGLEVHSVESLTGFGEVLGGRVKTLHPLIYGGLLATSEKSHQQQRMAMGAPDIRVVVVNLYPFERRFQEGLTGDALIEEIDIGGVSLIRAAAKNYQRVAILVSPEQYASYLERSATERDDAYRRELAVQAFRHVTYYDGVIASALADDFNGTWPEQMTLTGTRTGELRYGENPHQPGAFYHYAAKEGFSAAHLLQGKALSFNNYADADAAVKLAVQFESPVAVAVKHQTPCGVGLGEDIGLAYEKAHAADSVSIFGGVVALNRPIDESLARRLTEIFLEVIIAPAVTDEAQAVFRAKKNLRVLVMPFEWMPSWDLKGVLGGFLIQPSDAVTVSDTMWHQVAGPRWQDMTTVEDMTLAWTTVASVKSNAIVVVKDGQTLGIGGGQTNRIDAARQALDRAGEGARGAVLASDGFFPFGDVVELAAERGITVIVQPGGSVRDQDSVDGAENHQIALVVTGERHFRH